MIKTNDFPLIKSTTTEAALLQHRGLADRMKRITSHVTLAILLPTTILLASCEQSNHSKPYFSSREEADEACLRDLEDHIKTEIKKSSDSRFYDNYTPIKSKYEEYAVVDFDCKPIFSKSSTTAYLEPTYFYIDGGVDTVQKKYAYSIHPKDYKGKPYSFRYSYPLPERVDFEATSLTIPSEPYSFPFASIKADSLSKGIAIGFFLHTCRNVYKYNIITQAQGEREIQESREYLKKVNKDSLFGPLSSNGLKTAQEFLDKGWENCKAAGASGLIDRR